MRKNKKLFAILTLVAFMMTLMPVLAFGAQSANSTITAIGTPSVKADGTKIVVPLTGVNANDNVNIFEVNASGKVVGSVIEDTTASASGTNVVVEITETNLTAGRIYGIVGKNGGNITASAGDDLIISGTTKAPTFTYTKALDDLAATEVAGTALDLTVGKARTFLVANAKAPTVAHTGKVSVAKGIISSGIEDEIASKNPPAQTVESGSTTKVAVAGNSGYTWTIDSVGSLTGVVEPSTGLTHKVDETKTGTVTFKVVDDACAAAGYDDIYKEKSISVTVNPPAAATLDDAVKVLNGQNIVFPVTAGTNNVPFNVAIHSSFSSDVTVLAFSDSLRTAMAGGVTADNAQLIGVDTSAPAVGTVTLKLVKDGKDAEVTINLTIKDGTNPPPESTDDASVDASIIATKDANATVEADGTLAQGANNTLVFTDRTNNNKITVAGDTKYTEVELVVRYKNNQSYTKSKDIYVWAEENGKSRQASDALVINKGETGWTNDAKNFNIYKINVTGGVETINVGFVRAGSYSLKASFVDPTTSINGKALLSSGDVATLKTVTNKNTITANSVAPNTRLFTVDVAAGKDKATPIAWKLEDGKKTTEAPFTDALSDGFVAVSANTVATTPVTLTLYSSAAANAGVLSTYPIKLSTNSANVELDKTSVTTDYKGEATFNIAGMREGEYKIYVTIGDYESTIMVRVGATSANNIELIKFPSHPIATDTMVEDYSGIFQFRLTDANGNIVAPTSGVASLKYTLNGIEKDGGVTAGACAATDTNPDRDEAKYVSVVKAPEANRVQDADLYLRHVTGEDYYTLYVGSNKSFSAEGDYEIRVVLDNGKSATLNFSVKKFDKARSLHIEYPTTAVELNSTTVVPDIYFLDDSNVMKKANNRVTVAAQGYAVATVVENGRNAGRLTVKNDEKYVGQTITVTAASDKENLIGSTTLTVADEAREVKLDSNRGAVNANNRIGFKVVDSTGTPVALGRDISLNDIEVTAIVTNTGDPDAKVSYSVSGNSRSELLSQGTGVINLSSNKQTTATVQIIVKVTKNRQNPSNNDVNNTGLSTTYYTGTETFTFGAEADKSVVMTIGSKEIVAQNVPVTIDVAPFIQDNRTYVPFRALVEAFGADVDYNADNNTVTTKLDGKTVVLTVGSTVLTVNDETVTMDVAPFIVDDRVVVPVRFVGEAFGFTVEATQDADTGATASVVFYQK